MTVPAVDDGTLRFSTESFAERERPSALREVLGREISHVEFEPLADAVHADVTARCVGGIHLMTIDHSPMRFSRTRTLLADGDDGLVLTIAGGGCEGAQWGREMALSPGDAGLIANGDACTVSCFGPSMLLKLAPQALRPLIADFESAIMRRVPADTPALRFLRGYIGSCDHFFSTAAAELRELFVSHVYDLAALTLGATVDAAGIARTRGGRAARLHAARSYVIRHLGQENLTAASVGAHLGVSARYVHMLFQDEGRSLSEFVLEERLTRVHRMLQEARHAGKSISTIAFSLGFVDLSHFNRSFRRRYGCTPSDVRAAAAQGE